MPNALIEIPAQATGPSRKRWTSAECAALEVSTVWVQGHIFDQDLPNVRLGDVVDETNTNFTQTFHGTIAYIGSFDDPVTRTTDVRIVTQNPEELLKKDMFAGTVIHTGMRLNNPRFRAPGIRNEW